MHDYLDLANQLTADPEVWEGTSFSPVERESCISQLIAGAIAIELPARPAEVSLSKHFEHAEISGTRYIVPGRYQEMLHFFSESRCRPAEQRGDTINVGENTLVTGGPGTGKSFQISRFVEKLSASVANAPLRVAVVAPTGKAAARFAGLEKLPNILLECLTIHRLLQLSADGSRARYDAANPLPLDMLIVDEISMVDLGLFARLIAALPLHAQLVIAGDIGQLPAVDGIAIGPALEFLKVHRLLRHIELTVTHRFSAEKAAIYSALQRDGITAVNGQSNGISVTRLSDTQSLYNYVDTYTREFFGSRLLDSIVERFSGIEINDTFWQETAKEILRYLQGSIILCEANEGSHGTAALNRRMAAARNNHANMVTPIMVTTNSYELQLFNGDTGFIFNNGRHDQVIIESGGRVKCLPLGRLRNWQMAYAITVHKSQGSEYEKVIIIHEPKKVKEADHRLLYTAVTRAREQAIILRLY